MSSDSDSNPFSPGPSEQPTKTAVDPKEAAKKTSPVKIKKEKLDEEIRETKQAPIKKDGATDKKEPTTFKDDDNELGFSNSFLEAKLSTYKTKNQLETEDREKMQ